MRDPAVHLGDRLSQVGEDWAAAIICAGEWRLAVPNAAASRLSGNAGGAAPSVSHANTHVLSKLDHIDLLGQHFNLRG